MINEQIAEIKERYDYLQKYVVITNKVKESLADIPVLISALEEAEQKIKALHDKKHNRWLFDKSDNNTAFGLTIEEIGKIKNEIENTYYQFGWDLEVE